MRSKSESARICLSAAALMVGVCTLAGSVRAGTFLDNQNFATLEQASSAGFDGVNNQTALQSYGFSKTNNASGVAGEAGGSFRMEAARTYYADETLGGTL